MLQTTFEATRALFKTDPTVSPSDRARLMSQLRQGPLPEAHVITSTSPRLIRAAEVARRMSVSPRTVARLAKDGILIRRRLPGRMRSLGFLESDVSALIEGQEASK